MKYLTLTLTLSFGLGASFWIYNHIYKKNKNKNKQNKLRSINYHFLRECNFSCKYCFHVDKNSSENVKTNILSINQMKKLLTLLKKAGCEKINFSGGEPFLKAKQLGIIVQFSKQDLGLKTGIISNGSLIKQEWFEKYGQYLDWLGISMDSFQEQILKNIGRNSMNKKPSVMFEQLMQIKLWCQMYKIRFKINTVVSIFNKDEDMNAQIQLLKPERWKVFQALAIDGENLNNHNKNTNKRDSLTGDIIYDQYLIFIADNYNNKNQRGSLTGEISHKEYLQFIQKHSSCHPIVKSNDIIKNSYIIVDEKGRFLDNSTVLNPKNDLSRCTGTKVPSKSILEVNDALKAFQNTVFDHTSFQKRLGNEPIDIIDIEDIVF